MPSLKIRIHKNGSESPDTTISVPLGILRVATKMLPDRFMSSLRSKGLDPAMLAELARHPEVRGTVAEIEEHTRNERIVIAVE